MSWKARPSPRRVRAEAGKAGDVLARDEDLAGAGAQLAGDQIEVGGLAGAVRADDGGERAGRERARHVVDRDMAAEADR